MSTLDKYSKFKNLEGLVSYCDKMTGVEQNLVAELLELDQSHLFENWDYDGLNDNMKSDFISSIVKANSSYPGGLVEYISNAKTLLRNASLNSNPFEGFSPQQPNVIDLTVLNDDYCHYEDIAKDHYNKIGFVLVAGGLGERLGYSGVKLDIPIEVLEHTTYLKHYAESIQAMEARMPVYQPVPFVIMTSEDTDKMTLQTLEQNKYFGLNKDQVYIITQRLVPAISDNHGRLALKEKYKMIMKPHGHGDVHMLLHSSGIAEELSNKGIEHLVFIQDTNGQVFNALLPAVGVSIEHNYDFNTIAVNRVPGEPVGAIAKLVSASKELTINVEYNQLDSLLRETICSDGDIPNENGFSMFPGNTNVLVVKLSSYNNILRETQGVIAEFVNPKYVDDDKVVFNKPTRLETMMQDLPKLFDSDKRVGVTIFDRKWCFSADKNNIEDAAHKHSLGLYSESATTAESDFYLAGRMKLATTGSIVNEGPEELIFGVPFTCGPKIILHPSFSLTINEVKVKITNCTISDEATLIVEGKNVHLNNVTLSGRSALVIKACDGAKVFVENLSIVNDGFELVKLTEVELCSDMTPEYLRIRGYHFKNNGSKTFEFMKPGIYKVDSNGDVVEEF